MSADVWGLVQFVPWKSLRFVSLRGAACVSDGAISEIFSLDANIVKCPALIRDLPLKVGSFHALLFHTFSSIVVDS